MKSINRRRSKTVRCEQLEPRRLLSTYYVSTLGSDANAGTSAAPFATLQKAANLVKAGDTVIVTPGTYKGFSLGWNFAQNGTAAAPITFSAQPGVVINSPNPNTTDGIDLEGASYIVIQGFEVDGMARAGIRAVQDQHVNILNNKCDGNAYWGIYTSHSDYALIQGNIASHSAIQHGIYVANGCVYPIVRNNIIFGNYGCGIHMNGDKKQKGSGVITNALVDGNILFDNGAGGGSAINCDGVQLSRFQNNLLYNNHSSGISLFKQDAAGSSVYNVVVNNTIVMASDARWAVNIKDSSVYNTVFDNILYNLNPSKGAINIASDSLNGFRSDYNIVTNLFSANDSKTTLSLSAWRSATGQDMHSMVAPMASCFMNVAGGNFNLTSTSPADDTGVAVFNGYLAPSIDLLGDLRTEPDIGALADLFA